MRLLAFAVVSLVAAGCGGSDSERGRTVVAAFYPLAWAVERSVDDSVEVVNLTPPGAEPHDIELSPSDVETIREAELVVYVSGGFQPAVEDAVEERDAPSLDVLEGDADPHVWLDPIRFARAVDEIGTSLNEPARAATVRRQLEELDADYREGLAGCEGRVIVTTHAAFAGLARRYGLTQLALAGRSPEVEPSPRELERLIARARASGATTVFAEPLVSDDVAQTVAREADLTVATLDPVEGLSQDRIENGDDYLSVMRANLAALREALRCR